MGTNNIKYCIVAKMNDILWYCIGIVLVIASGISPTLALEQVKHNPTGEYYAMKVLIKDKIVKMRQVTGMEHLKIVQMYKHLPIFNYPRIVRDMIADRLVLSFNENTNYVEFKYIPGFSQFKCGDIRGIV